MEFGFKHFRIVSYRIIQLYDRLLFTGRAILLNQQLRLRTGAQKVL